MRFGRPTWLFAALALLCGAGCASPAPPYADLPVRDVLGADPEVLASMPVEQLAVVAQRLEERRAAEDDEDGDGVRLVEPTASAGAVRAIDDARLAMGRDALVVARLGAKDGSLVASAVPSEPDDLAPDLPALEGAAATGTREAEALALQGRAGRILRGLLRTSHANRLVRVTQWPSGAVAIERMVYVNASWLVALSTLESRDGGPARVVLLGPAATPSSIISTQSLRGSPFATYPTLAACVDDVSARCQACLSSGSCDAQATLTDFADGRSECEFLASDGASQKAVEELCVFALTSIDSVASCLTQSGCPPPPSTTTSTGLSRADGFLSNGECLRDLDVCLSGTDESADGGAPSLSVNVQTSGCLGPFDACASAFQALGDACNSGRCSGKGGPSCTSCSGCSTCSSCTPSPPGPGPGPVGGSGGSGSSGSSGNGGSSGTTGSGSGGTGSGSSGGTGGSSGNVSGSGGSGGSSGGSASGGGSTGGGGSRGGGGCSGGSGCSGNGNAGSGGCGSCSGNSGCSSCNGGGSTASTNSGCSCSGGASSGGSTSGNSSCGSKDCEVAAQSARATDPPVSLFWLALPAFYLGRRARRDARGS